MKRIAVVATEKAYAQFLMDNLAAYLGNHAEFRCYALHEVEAMEVMEEEFVAISAFIIFQNVKDKIKADAELIVLGLALNKERVEELKQFPAGTRAFLVNFDYRTCMQTITNLHWAGFRNLELTAYHGEGDYDKTITLAITPNEAHLVPPTVETVIDIGESVVDLNTVYDIADKLGVSELFHSEAALKAKNGVYFTNSSMERVLGETEGFAERLNTLIRLMKQGIIITDAWGKIHLSNEKAQHLLFGRTQLLTGFNIGEVLPEMGDGSLLAGGPDSPDQSMRDELIYVDRRKVIVSKEPIVITEETRGFVFTLDDFEEVEEKQHGVRAKISESRHEARFRFPDIKGESGALKKAVETAKRFAGSDFSVLITGGSGTGKEVFAQSIHNGSKRAKYNFVAVNCAAIPENLLESEMFGYEEGSFTGARKGGKIGYFEMAHKGTIFLDEIGEMPVQLQSKLLRVIEERKIIKIGSNKIVDVDVRIIAATNQNLYEMVKKGQFREDLYYRINVLPLQVPDLAERKGDIEILLQHFLKGLRCRLELTEKARTAIAGYHFPGNIRELRNVAEYLASLGKKVIEGDDLPPAILSGAGTRQGVSGEGERGSNPGSNLGSESVKPDKADIQPSVSFLQAVSGTEDNEKRFVLKEGERLSLHLFILQELLTAGRENLRLGRNSLKERAEKAGLFYTEMEIRGALNKLDTFGFVRTGKGRGGSVITREGKSFLEKMKQVQW